jgi:hypothetical protein
VRNGQAVASVFFGLLALTVLLGGGAATRFVDEVGFREAVWAVPAGFFLALASLSLARRARFTYQRTLGRSGGSTTAAFGRFLGVTALLVALTAALALGVYAVLELFPDVVD